jgi:hypothetical protein
LSNLDWSRFRNVDGVETTVNRPFAFPLVQGKHWEIDYTESNPNPAHRSEHFHSTYTVVGWEQVKVPAGTFNALKIEGDGNWTAVLAPAVGVASQSRVTGSGATTVMQSQKVSPQTVSGRTYKLFYYVPAVKRWVKSVEEYYSGGEVRTERYTDELESFKPAS